jgi:hypothetical protein
MIVRILKQDADIEAHSGQKFGGKGLPSIVERAALQRQDSVEMPCEGGFSGTVFADQGDAVTPMDGKVDILEGRFSIGIGEGEVIDFEKQLLGWVPTVVSVAAVDLMHKK